METEKFELENMITYITPRVLEENESKAGEIFVNMDLNKENPIFRERV